MKMYLIKQNQKNGKEIEDLISYQISENEEIISQPEGRTFYDIETEKSFIEVKTCHQTIKNGKPKKLRNGRFWIFDKSHKQIKVEADKINKQVWYVFVLLDSANNIVVQKRLDWQAVESLVRQIKPRAHGDYGINYNSIFKEEFGK